jgi:hypothetical protein
MGLALSAGFDEVTITPRVGIGGGGDRGHTPSTRT